MSFLATPPSTGQEFPVGNGQESVKIDTMFIEADVANDPPGAWLYGKAAEGERNSREAAMPVWLSPIYFALAAEDDNGS
jgi:hypothetical protein